MELQTSKAYATVYHTAYAALPDCKGCLSETSNMRGYFGKCQELIANVEIFLAISFNLQRNPPCSVAATTNLCVFPFSRRNLLSMCSPT